VPATAAVLAVLLLSNIAAVDGIVELLADAGFGMVVLPEAA